MRIIVVVSTLDLRFRLGSTPAWLQLLKALHETGNEITVIPYLGRETESLWWEARPNAWRFPGEVYHSLSRKVFGRRTGLANRYREELVQAITKATTIPIWSRYLHRILETEKETDAIMFLGVPLNQMKGLSTELKSEFSVKTVFYEGDMPAILPEHNVKRGFMFDAYQGADLTEYDLFLANSDGVIPMLKRMGARNAHSLHYAADPDVFRPIQTDKRCDVAFYGYGSQNREKWMKKMISEPSLCPGIDFVVGGGGFSVSLGKATMTGDVPMNEFRRFCCSSKLNLNISRESHAEITGSSSARPFELAALECCVVSSPYNGLENWFVPDSEIIILSENDDVPGVYESLLSDEERRLRMGTAARNRVIKEHTYHHRASSLVSMIRQAKSQDS
jgi:glycosyltransferase involved in cell wall biosynthesis